MNLAPSERFLGVTPGSGPRELLGLARDAMLDKQSIDRALSARMTMIARHPGGQSEDAEQLRETLQRAAESLRDEMGIAPEAASSSFPRRQESVHRFDGRGARRGPSHSARPAIALTEFDRQVLGTLVGSGGWNRASRARLVSIASMHRVTVQGLLTVIRRLNNYARSGGARLDVATITAGQRMLVPASVDLPRRAPLSLAERLLPELKEPTPATKVKWSLVFGLLALAFGAVIIAMVMSDRERPAVTPVLPEDETPPTMAQQDQSLEDVAQVVLSREPATYPQPATFSVSLDDLIPAEIIAQCARLPEELNHIADRIRVSAEPGEAIFRDWNELVDVASRAWVTNDEALNQEIISAMRAAFEESASRPGVGERLLFAFDVPSTWAGEPIDIPRRAWRIARLAELSQALRLPPEVRDRSAIMLAAAMIKSVDTRTMTPPEVAGAWLMQAVSFLGLDLDVSPRIYQSWELWIAAVKLMTSGDEQVDVFAGAAESILQSHLDLTMQSPAVNVLGRLLEEIDWSNPVAHARLAAWFEDAERISSDDMWVLTSLIAEKNLASWFDVALLLPRGADAAHRRRVRDQIAAAWPREPESESPRAGLTGRGIEVDGRLLKEWREIHAELASAATPVQPAAQAAHLAILARLNEAASLLQHDDTLAASRVLEWIVESRASASIVSGPSALSQPRGPMGVRQGTRQPGQPIGQDGVWAAAYAQVGTAADGRSNLIRSLRSTAGTDLGPTDATAFVREVYRATPAEVRAMAQSVALMFSTGPNVALQLLDQLPDAVANEDTSEFLQRFTGRHLPPVRSEQWRIDARRTLLEHCLSYMPSAEGDVDRAGAIVADAVARQGPALQPDLAQQAAHASPAEAAELIRQAWANAMRGVVSAEPVPGDLEFIEKRHRTRRQLARGPLQSYLANRIGHAELLAFAVTAEQPVLRVMVSEMLAASGAKRAPMPDALMQAIEVENLMAALNGLRMRERRDSAGGDA